MNNKIIRIKEVLNRVGLSKSSLYSYISQGKFPRPCKIGLRAIGFMESEVNAWLEERAEQRGGK